MDMKETYIIQRHFLKAFYNASGYVRKKQKERETDEITDRGENE